MKFAKPLVITALGLGLLLTGCRQTPGSVDNKMFQFESILDQTADQEFLVDNYQNSYVSFVLYEDQRTFMIYIPSYSYFIKGTYSQSGSEVTYTPITITYPSGGDSSFEEERVFTTKYENGRVNMYIDTIEGVDVFGVFVEAQSPNNN